MRLRRACARWVALWNRREPATSLAIVRIGVALVLLYDFVQVGLLGLVEDIWAPAEVGGMSGMAARSWLWSVLGGDLSATHIVYGAAVVSASALAVGLASRVSAAVLLVASAQLAHIQPWSDRGIDVALRWVLLVLALSAAGTTLSADARLRHGRWSRPQVLVPAWPRYLIVAQLLWMYFSAATHKLQGPWTPVDGFTALHYVLADPHLSNVEGTFLATFSPLTRVATFLTMAFEWSAPAMLLAFWYRHTRHRPGKLRAFVVRHAVWLWWIALGATFHVGLAFTMRLGIFPAGMLALYPAFFHPRDLDGARRAAVLRRWYTGGREAVDDVHRGGGRGRGGAARGGGGADRR